MFQIDDPTAAAVMPTPEAAGTQGWFTEGNPATNTPATNVRASFLNGLQKELMNLLAEMGATPSKTTYTQVRDAIYGMIAAKSTASMAVNGWQKLPSGLIVQWGVNTADASGNVVVTLPIAFPTVGYVAITNGPTAAYITSATSWSTTTITMEVKSTSGTGSAQNIRWVIIGK